jgi:nitric oxide reductase large subunit
MFSLQALVTLAIGWGVLIALVIVLLDASRRPAHGFRSEGKLDKTKWMLILGFAGVVALLGALGMIGVFLNLVAVVPAAIYWVDVRPRLLRYGTGGGPQRPGGNTGGW